VFKAILANFWRNRLERFGSRKCVYARNLQVFVAGKLLQL